MTRPQGTPALLRRSIQSCDRALRVLLVDQGLEALAVLHPRLVGREIRIVQQIGEAQLVQKTAHDRRVLGATATSPSEAWNRP